MTSRNVSTPARHTVPTGAKPSSSNDYQRHRDKAANNKAWIGFVKRAELTRRERLEFDDDELCVDDA